MSLVQQKELIIKELKQSFYVDENLQEKIDRIDEEREPHLAGTEYSERENEKLHRRMNEKNDLYVSASSITRNFDTTNTKKELLESFEIRIQGKTANDSITFTISPADAATNNDVILKSRYAINDGVSIAGVVPEQVVEVVREVRAWDHYAKREMDALRQGTPDSSQVSSYAYEEGMNKFHIDSEKLTAYVKSKLQEKFAKLFGAQVKVE